MNTNKLYIFCGIAGSGKTTKAKKITNCVFEADNYWLNCVGDYLFVPTKIGKAHQWCQAEVRKAMEDGKTSIAVSNTSLTPKERKPYIDLAKEFGYEVSLELPDSPWFLDILPRLRDKTFTDDDVWTFVRKNTHGVPFDSIKKMMERWDETFNID
jgi:hypothetical protein